MTILPHHIAATLLLGTLTIGGYFTINSFIPPSLQAHLKSLNLEPENNWKNKATKYKDEKNIYLITSIDSKNNLENLLKQWCNLQELFNLMYYY